MRIRHLGKGEDWRSLAVSDWFLAIKEELLIHVIASPAEVYEISMETNRRETQGKMKMRIGTARERDLLDVKRHDQNYRKHSGEHEKEPCLTGNEK